MRNAHSLAVHQLLLSYGHLQTYILHAPRASWVSANKEGIISLTGLRGLSTYRNRVLERYRVPLNPSHGIVYWNFNASSIALVVPSHDKRPKKSF